MPQPRHSTGDDSLSPDSSTSIRKSLKYDVNAYFWLRVSSVVLLNFRRLRLMFPNEYGSGFFYMLLRELEFDCYEVRFD